jgi:hypothetical protein
MDYFKKSAKNLKNIAQYFKSIMNDEVSIKINQSEPSEIFVYEINKKIILSEDNIVSLLGTIMYKTNASTEFRK